MKLRERACPERLPAAGRESKGGYAATKCFLDRDVAITL